MEPGQVRTCEVDALVDTGATRSIIATDVAAQLGLTIRHRALGQLADGSRVSVGVSSTIRFEIQGRETSEDAYVLGSEVLIGQTVLESTDLLVDCRNRKVIPNPAHPDGPVFRL
jgi:clan AA aspartic protease